MLIANSRQDSVDLTHGAFAAQHVPLNTNVHSPSPRTSSSASVIALPIPLPELSNPPDAPSDGPPDESPTCIAESVGGEAVLAKCPTATMGSLVSPMDAPFPRSPDDEMVSEVSANTPGTPPFSIQLTLTANSQSTVSAELSTKREIMLYACSTEEHYADLGQPDEIHDLPASSLQNGDADANLSRRNEEPYLIMEAGKPIARNPAPAVDVTTGVCDIPSLPQPLGVAAFTAKPIDDIVCAAASPAHSEKSYDDVDLTPQTLPAVSDEHLSPAVVSLMPVDSSRAAVCSPASVDIFPSSPTSPVPISTTDTRKTIFDTEPSSDNETIRPDTSNAPSPGQCSADALLPVMDAPMKNEEPGIYPRTAPFRALEDDLDLTLPGEACALTQGGAGEDLSVHEDVPSTLRSVIIHPNGEGSNDTLGADMLGSRINTHSASTDEVCEKHLLTPITVEGSICNALTTPVNAVDISGLRPQFVPISERDPTPGVFSAWLTLFAIAYTSAVASECRVLCF